MSRNLITETGRDTGSEGGVAGGGNSISKGTEL